MKFTSRRLVLVGIVAALSLVGLACGDNTSDSDSRDSAPSDTSRSSGGPSVEDLRASDTCPLELDASQLPEGFALGEPESPSVSEHDDGVEVECDFPVEGSQSDETISVSIVAAETADDVWSMETDTGGSWRNGVFNATGVRDSEIEDAFAELEGVDVELLEGRGESLALRRVDVQSGAGLLLVYGEDTRTAEDLEAVAEALRPA